MEIHEYLDLDRQTGTITCNECGHELCAADRNYKKYCAMEAVPLTEVGPGFESPAELLNADHEIEFRRFYCPGCAVLIEHEIARADDPILHDIEIDMAALREE